MTIVTRELSAGLWLIAPHGRLDQSLSPELEATLNRLLAQGHTRFIIDLSTTTYINSGGLRTLLTGLRQAREQGGTLLLSGLHERLRVVFTTVGLDQVIPIYETTSEAEAALG